MSNVSVFVQPTSIDLPAGTWAAYTLRFFLAAGAPTTRDAALAAVGEPVINAVPGYTIGTDMTTAHLLIQVDMED
jgi:hypothetical protein